MFLVVLVLVRVLVHTNRDALQVASARTRLGDAQSPTECGPASRRSRIQPKLTGGEVVKMPPLLPKTCNTRCYRGQYVYAYAMHVPLLMFVRMLVRMLLLMSRDVLYVAQAHTRLGVDA